MDGFLNILKPPGMSSAAVVASVRRLTGEKRVGHAGTLDPEAAGVLPMMVGKAARLFDFLADKEKEYISEVAFGMATDTQDVTGAVTATGTSYPDEKQVLEAVGKLTGDILQRPGAYSALKKDGVPLYQRARRGEKVEAPERMVHVESIDVMGEKPNHGWLIHVACGRGTYIRSICEDLGRLVGCPAHMRFLLRSRTGAFDVDSAITLEEADLLSREGRMKDAMLPVDFPLQHIERIAAKSSARKKIMAGAALGRNDLLDPLPETEKPVRLYLDNVFWGMMIREEERLVWRAQIAPETPASDGNMPETQAEEPQQGGERT